MVCIIKELVVQLFGFSILLLISQKAGAMAFSASQSYVQDMQHWDAVIAQVVVLVAKWIISPIMVLVAANISTKIKSASDRKLENPKQTKFKIAVVAAFGMWFVLGWRFNMPFEARMPLVLTVAAISPPIFVNVYGYVNELRTLAKLQQFLGFLSRLKHAFDLVDKNGLKQPEKEDEKRGDGS